MTNIYYHNHHIIPKHMNGPDNPKNIVRLTIQEHAEAHRLLYEEYNCQEDYIAWKALSGLMTMSEIKRAVQLAGSSKGGKIGGKLGGEKAKKEKLGFHTMTTEQHREKGLKCVRQKIGIHDPNWDKAIGAKKGGDKCRNEKLGFHAMTKEERSFNKGTFWINKDDIERKCRNNSLEQFLSEGWVKGRKLSFRK